MMRTSIGSILLCAWVLWAGGAGQWALVDAYEKKAECDAQRALANNSPQLRCLPSGTKP
jgi:hypothetical protein